MKLISIDQQSSPHSNYQRTVKLKNLKRAFDLIRSGHCDSRVALAREMDLSATAVSTLVEELVKANMILEAWPNSPSCPVVARRSINSTGTDVKWPSFL